MYKSRVTRKSQSRAPIKYLVRPALLLSNYSSSTYRTTPFITISNALFELQQTARLHIEVKDHASTKSTMVSHVHPCPKCGLAISNTQVCPFCK